TNMETLSSATPEPSSYALMLLGLGGLAFSNKKRQSSHA
ncbi:MAG: PEP-CTERM sorting domain-containing protein, partial [Lentisphaeraceae bacterium]|nr:PEP-CTERM sorting domain-containing protein [Lentisphaeraceae bacterium]